MNIEFVGGIAGFITTVSLLPQVMKVVKTKDVSGLSVHYFFMLITGVVLWIVYGFLKESISLILANSFSFILILIILIHILKDTYKSL